MAKYLPKKERKKGMKKEKDIKDIKKTKEEMSLPRRLSYFTGKAFIHSPTAYDYILLCKSPI